MYEYHKDGTQPMLSDGSVIFVFGSNLSGIHGAGAAKAAFDVFDARWGIGFGKTGRSFAIPTKDWVIDSMTLDEIRPFVHQFVKYTHKNLKNRFFITRVGCGLAGWKDSDIAPMFKGCNTNCNFSEEWKEHLE